LGGSTVVFLVSPAKKATTRCQSVSFGFGVVAPRVELERLRRPRRERRPE
jgi:hypothetical protein